MGDISGHQPGKSFRHCPGCGAESLAERPDRSVLCSGCGFHYYFNPAAAVAGIIEDDLGRLLLTVRAHDPRKGALDLPGGFVDFSESAEDALRREVREELNLNVLHCDYFGSFPNTYVFDRITYRTLDLAFTCTIESFEPMALSDEIESTLIVPPSEIELDCIGFDSIRNILFRYLNSRSLLPPCTLL